MKRALFCVLAILLPNAATADRTIPYADLHTMFARLASLQGGTYLKAEARLTSTDPAVATPDIKLVIQSRNGELRVPVAADGTTEFPIRLDLLRENPPVLTNVAEGKLQLSVSLRVEAPPMQRFRYGLMVLMQEEAGAMFAKQGMLARMLAPDFEGLVIGFPAGTPASAILETAKGPVRFATDASGSIRIPDRREWRREDPFVQLSAMPTQIALDSD